MVVPVVGGSADPRVRAVAGLAGDAARGARQGRPLPVVPASEVRPAEVAQEVPAAGAEQGGRSK